MLIGLPQEIKNHEYRVGLTPASVRELTQHGHQVLVQMGAGDGIGMGDALYVAAGATLVADAAQVFAQADMVVKVKEPQPQECAMLRPGQICTPTCTWRLTRRKRQHWSSRGLCVLPMKPSPAPVAACRCWRR